MFEDKVKVTIDEAIDHFEAVAAYMKLCGHKYSAHSQLAIYMRRLRRYEQALQNGELEWVDPNKEKPIVEEIIHSYWEETTQVTKSKRGRKTTSILVSCANCHTPNGRKKDNYCHECGAKMDKERIEQ